MKIGGDTVELSKQYRVYLGVIMGVSYALVHCLFRLLSKEPINPIQVVFQVAFFSLFWYFVFFRLKLKIREKSIVDVMGHQEVSFYGVAHQIVNTSGIMGVLYAREKQLIFTPETTNFVESPLTIDFENIVQVDVYKSMWLFEFGILIRTKENRTFKFRVNEPQIWVAAIQNKIILTL